MANTLPKTHRLSSRKAIQALFTSGNRITQYPLSISYVIIPESESPWPKAGVSVSKRKFASAVKRNRIKRMMREAYRVNNEILKEFCEKEKVEVQLFFVYLEKTELEFSEIEDKISKLILRLHKHLADEKK